MLSMASLLSFSISAMDADTAVHIPFGLARRILRLLSTLRYYIDKAVTTMIAADDMICTIIRELGNEIEAQGAQPHPFHGPIF